MLLSYSFARIPNTIYHSFFSPSLSQKFDVKLFIIILNHNNWFSYVNLSLDLPVYCTGLVTTRLQVTPSPNDGCLVNSGQQRHSIQWGKEEGSKNIYLHDCELHYIIWQFASTFCFMLVISQWFSILAHERYIQTWGGLVHTKLLIADNPCIDGWLETKLIGNHQLFVFHNVS